jgi:hypothetical protein
VTSRRFKVVVDGVTVGAVALAREALLIVNVNELAVAVAPFASVTRTVTVWVDGADGVPRITPVELSMDSPAGSVPEFTSNT